MALFGIGKKKDARETALVFIDFEYMQISFKHRYGIEPPILDWYEELKERYSVSETYVYADFSNSAMKNNIYELRKITNNIIETQNTASHYKKDFTDFFILDTMYQKAFEGNKADVYILFTGDGHFGGVSRFLREKVGKKVVIYGIESTISGTLRSSADMVVEYPTYDKLKRMYFPLLARAMQAADGRIKKQNIISTVSGQNQIPENYVTDALDDMISAGYVTEAQHWAGRRRVRVLECSWEKMKEDGIL